MTSQHNLCRPIPGSGNQVLVVLVGVQSPGEVLGVHCSTTVEGTSESATLWAFLLWFPEGKV